MTAEVAILNRECVALAADSAVTLTGGHGQKIFTSANKIFQLSKFDPVALMIYDSSTVNDLAWETVIKRYRDQLAGVSFATLDDHVQDFFAYIQAQRASFFPSTIQRDTFRQTIYSYLQLIRDLIETAMSGEAVTHGRPLTISETQHVAETVLDQHHAIVLGGSDALDVPVGYVRSLAKLYGSLIPSEIDDVLGPKYGIRTAAKRRLRATLLNLFARVPAGLTPPVMSGLVFAGFGGSDIFPQLREFHVEGVVADFVKRHRGDSITIELDGLRATIVPFAQREMVARFMEGVDPEYSDVVDTVIEEIIDEYPNVLLAGLPGLGRRQRNEVLRRARLAKPATIQTVQAHLARVREAAFWSPVTMLVDVLPKEEVAAMAEALVNLTSVKRRVSWDPETVGGPIDVAVISRGDGFVWIKRKHYFTPDLNPGFMSNRYGGRR